MGIIKRQTDISGYGRHKAVTYDAKNSWHPTLQLYGVFLHNKKIIQNFLVSTTFTISANLQSYTHLKSKPF